MCVWHHCHPYCLFLKVDFFFFYFNLTSFKNHPKTTVVTEKKTCSRPVFSSHDRSITSRLTTLRLCFSLWFADGAETVEHWEPVYLQTTSPLFSPVICLVPRRSSTCQRLWRTTLPAPPGWVCVCAWVCQPHLQGAIVICGRRPWVMITYWSQRAPRWLRVVGLDAGSESLSSECCLLDRKKMLTVYLPRWKHRRRMKSNSGGSVSGSYLSTGSRDSDNGECQTVGSGVR